MYLTFSRTVLLILGVGGTMQITLNIPEITRNEVMCIVTYYTLPPLEPSQSGCVLFIWCMSYFSSSYFMLVECVRQSELFKIAACELQ